MSEIGIVAKVIVEPEATSTLSPSLGCKRQGLHICQLLSLVYGDHSFTEYRYYDQSALSNMCGLVASMCTLINWDFIPLKC
jgi:hypothetical protein